jgi:hypothetical protein
MIRKATVIRPDPISISDLPEFNRSESQPKRGMQGRLMIIGKLLRVPADARLIPLYSLRSVGAHAENEYHAALNRNQ